MLNFPLWQLTFMVKLQVTDGDKRTRKVGRRDMVHVNYIPISVWHVRVRHAISTDFHFLYNDLAQGCLNSLTFIRNCRTFYDRVNI